MATEHQSASPGWQPSQCQAGCIVSKCDFKEHCTFKTFRLGLDIGRTFSIPQETEAQTVHMRENPVSRLALSTKEETRMIRQTCYTASDISLSKAIETMFLSH
jgi:hypothetical protein